MPASADATRARILDAARRLLNERGIAGVSLRRVAGAAGISHGNLCYHFANLDVIVAALYHQLVADSSAQLAAVTPGPSPLATLWALQAATFDLMYAYRVLFLDYVAIFRAQPALRRHLARLKRQRAQQFGHFVAWLRQCGLIAPEPQRGHDRLLFAQYDLMSDFWIAQAEIQHRRRPRLAKRLYQRVAFALFVPLLTEEGLAQYRAAIAAGISDGSNDEPR